MGFALNKNFPALDIAFSNSPIAFIFSRTAGLKIVRIKAIKDAFFICPWGWYELKPEFAVPCYKQKVFVYSSFNKNPLDVKSMKIIEAHLLRDDSVTLERWIEDENEKLLSDMEAATEISFKFDTEEDGKIKTDKEGKPLLIPAEKRKQIAKTLRAPINPHIETWLANFASIDPNLLMTGTETIHQTKKIKDLLSHPVTTKIPIILVIVGIIGFLVFMQQGPTWLTTINGMLHPGAGEVAKTAGHFILSLLGR